MQRKVFRKGVLGGKAEFTPRFIIEDDKMYRADSLGNKGWGAEPSYVIENNKLYECSGWGAKTIYEPDFVIENNEIFALSSWGIKDSVARYIIE